MFDMGGAADRGYMRAVRTAGREPHQRGDSNLVTPPPWRAVTAVAPRPLLFAPHPLLSRGEEFSCNLPISRKKLIRNALSNVKSGPAQTIGPKGLLSLCPPGRSVRRSARSTHYHSSTISRPKVSTLISSPRSSLRNAFRFPP